MLVFTTLHPHPPFPSSKQPIGDFLSLKSFQLGISWKFNQSFMTRLFHLA